MGVDCCAKEAAGAGVKALHDTECRARSIIVRGKDRAGRRRRSHREKLDRKTALVCKLW